ncbi:hypothetical protein NQ315_011528 [Exocentrus adspersus]|uniref:Immunoglobulin I-set domain-containing protein n=1 Tax=Exocentrus adspersus TaxID=1586481 RepID=A0AAV8VWP6_9CUCU|nr:hypothetical protein NQ315_011528 [Exocentrus adspersus]
MLLQEKHPLSFIPSTKYTIREDRSGYKVFMWLVIRSFAPGDIGTYNCVSTNSLGRAEGTLRLYAQHSGLAKEKNNNDIPRRCLQCFQEQNEGLLK